MSQVAYRANLNSGFFPFLSRYQGQTVIISGKDQAFKNSQVIGETDKDEDKGIPQLYYCHNVIPTVQGIQSIGIVQRFAGIPGVTIFSEIFSIRDIEENKFLFSPSGGVNYIYNANFGMWQSVSPLVQYASNALTTIAYLNGETYIFFDQIGCFKYNRVTNLLEPVVLVGLNVTLIHGICESSGFLLCWDDFTIYRSQIVNPLDFTPDPSLGSGSSIPQGLEGKIVICLHINDGFVIYSTRNIIGASFSQNIRFPFIYNEVDGSAGIANSSHVAWLNNTGVHYAWTKAGLLSVNKTKAVIVFPEVTDFLIAKIFEDYDDITDTFTVTRTPGNNLNVSLAVTGKRFLVISYGISEFTHALVYDLSIKRWGKVKLTHVAAFELAIPNLSGDITWEMFGDLTWDDLGDTTWADLEFGLDTIEQPKETLAFLSKDGTVNVIEMDQVGIAHTGVAIFGKYQYIRERVLQLDEIEFENIDQQITNFELKVLSSTNGKTIDQITTPYLNVNTDTYRQYLTTVNGKNHSLVTKGTFFHSHLALNFNLAGRP